MHILFVVGKFPELTFVFRTIKALAERGHTVTVASRRRGNWKAFKDNLPLPGSMCVRYLLPHAWWHTPLWVLNAIVHIIRHPGSARRLWQACNDQPEGSVNQRNLFWRYVPFLGLAPDVIQFDFPMSAVQYALLSMLLEAPTVVSCRGADIHMLEQRYGKDREGRLWALINATALHCVSEEMSREVTRLSGRSDHMWVNRPAVDTVAILPRTTYRNAHLPKIIAVGRLTWKKGFDYLLASLARVRTCDIPYVASIIGEGELRSVLRFSIEDLDLSESVALVGTVPAYKVIDALHEADIFVLSSHEEGISNAVLEAMACGLPIVTTDAGGMAEVVRDGVEGFVVPVRDITLMTERIKQLLLDPDLRERMGRAARKRVEEAFTLERQARVFEEVYHHIVQQ